MTGYQFIKHFCPYQFHEYLNYNNIHHIHKNQSLLLPKKLHINVKFKGKKIVIVFIIECPYLLYWEFR